ncbi:kinase-like domain-containing protein [Daldinia bambusicola]|nr:kinase-like domain-containing protein [Daldinia bambusicola]
MLDFANISPHQGDPAYGFQWTRHGNFLSLRPEWTAEPTIDSIVLTLQKAIDPRKQYIVQHHWNGAYTKMYRVSYDRIHLILKVSLPVCPRTMTESEVATLRWVDQNTRLPVPKVHCYDSARNNPIGFEWILMDRIDGTPLFECWGSTTQDAKERIVKQIAEYAAICFARQFNGVGNVYYPPESHQSNSQPSVGEIASTAMLALVDRLRGLGDKFFLPPGPFNDSEPSTHEDESTDEEDAETINEKDKLHEQTMLWHDDISLDNVLVDENGVLQGVIGWSCVSCLPLYEACQFPAFLHQAWDRTIEPSTPYRVTRAYPENKEEIRKYGVELRQHHLTLLRRIFIDEMTQRCPEWVDVFDKQRSQRDYEAAVQNCDNEFAYRIVEEWVGDVEGKSDSNQPVWSLHERFMR